jgi:hypothetical protein
MKKGGVDEKMRRMCNDIERKDLAGLGQVGLSKTR